MGHESGSPEMDTETRVQALRGAAGAKPPQCTNVRRGYLECHLKKVAFPWSKKPREYEGGKTGVSRRGNTSPSSGGDDYLA